MILVFYKVYDLLIKYTTNVNKFKEFKSKSLGNILTKKYSYIKRDYQKDISPLL